MSYTETLKKNNEALDKMNEMLKKLNTTLDNFGKAQKEANKRTEEAVQQEDDLSKAVERRTASFNKAKKALAAQGKNFEVLSKKTLEAYRAAGDGANIFEFLDLALSNTSEAVKIFGFEAANVRKVMYGFLPRGMFRAVNKLSTAFRFLGNIRRKQLLGKEADEPDGILGNSIKGAMKFIELMNTTPKGMLDSIKKNKLFRDGVAISMENKTTGKGQTVSGTRDFYSQGELRKRVRALSKKTMTGQLSQKEKDEFKMRVKQMEELRKIRIKYIKESIKSSKFMGMIKKLPAFLKGALVVFGKIILVAMAIMVLVFFLYHTVYPALKDAFNEVKPRLQQITEKIGFVFGFMVKGFQKIYDGFLQGDLFLMLDGIVQSAVGILGMVGVVLLTALQGLWILGKEFLKQLWERAKIQAKVFFSDATAPIKKAATILALIAAGIAFFVSGAWIALLVGVAVYYLVQKLPKLFGGKGRETGGVINERMTLVGERGPELISAPAGSRVHTNSQTKRMLGGTTNNFHITINAKDTSKQELRRMADEIGRMVSSKINRTTSSSTFR